MIRTTFDDVSESIMKVGLHDRRALLGKVFLRLTVDEFVEEVGEGVMSQVD
jgi:hypothetical protein